MKSIDTSAARACGTADAANASMLNAKRIFFMVVSNVYETFDFSASGFIQLLIRKMQLSRACFVRMRKRLTMNGHLRTLIKAERTTDYTDTTGLGSARGSRAYLKAWPSLRVRCSGGLAETVFYFTTKNTKHT